MNQLTDKVIAYRLPEEGDEEMYGICIRREGNVLRVMVLQRDDNREAPLRSVLRKLSDEDGIVNSLEDRFSSLQSKLSKEQSSTAESQSYRLQETLLQWAGRRLDSVDGEEWCRLARESKPSAVCRAAGCAAACIAAAAPLSSSRWADAQALFKRGAELPAALRCAAEQRMRADVYSALEEGYVADATLSYAVVAKESPSLGILHKWITAVVDYQRARYVEDGEVQLLQQLSGCQSSLQSARSRRGSLVEQAELINAGNCYIRTQTVRSVRIECVSGVMVAEKVTTRQYLLRERAPFESLELTSARTLASARSGRGTGSAELLTSRGDIVSSNGDRAASAGANHTNAGVEVPMLSIPTPTGAGAGRWSGTRQAQERRPSLPPPATEAPAAAKTVPIMSSRHVTAAAAPDTEDSDAEVPASPALPSLSARSEGRRHNGSTREATMGSEQVLADVRNNFQNVQAVLLACLADYQELEDKYTNTVERSQQLLLSLEGRDRVIARLVREVAEKSMPGVSAVENGVRGQDGRFSANAELLDCTEHHPRAASPLAETNGAAPAAEVDDDLWEQSCEHMLNDTLEFLHGAASVATAFREGDTTQA